MRHDRQYTSVHLLAVFVPLFHLVFHLNLGKWNTISANVYRLFLTFFLICSTVPLELKLLSKFFCYRLRRLLSNRCNRCNRIYALYENFLKMPVQVEQWNKTDFPFESEEVANGVMG